MPEENPNNNNTSDDKIINKTDEEEELENGRRSKIQEMLHIIQNFFNNVPTKWISNKFKDRKPKLEDKKPNLTGQNNAVMNRNARNSPQNDLSRDKENNGAQKNVNDNSRHRVCRIPQFQDNEQLQQSVNDSFKNLQFDVDKLKELKTKGNDKNNETRNIKVEALLQEEKGTESSRNKPEKSIAVKVKIVF